jgi:hypothetical protein
MLPALIKHHHLSMLQLQTAGDPKAPAATVQHKYK